MSARAALIIPITFAAASLACGHPEQRIVDQYFNALRAGDNVTLTSFAMVAFDQKVENWKVTGGEPEVRSPAALPELAKKAATLEAELAANKKAAGSYSLEKYADIDKVKELQRASQPVPAGLSKVAETWGQFNEKDRDLKRQVADAKAAVEKEKRNVALSVGQVEDIDKLTGEMIQKTLDLDLTIQGQTKPYTMVLRKYELQGGGGRRMVSRWVIQELKPKA
jgi:hypothetical protein